MTLRQRLTTVALSVLAAGALSSGVADAGEAGLQIDPNPVTAGSSPTFSGICPTSAEFARITFSVTLTAGGFVDVTTDIPSDPGTGSFSGAIAIHVDASAQSVQVLGRCIDTADGEIIVGTLGGSLGVLAAPPSTDAPATSTASGGLPPTGAGAAPLLLAGVATVGVGAVLVALRRRPAR